MNEVKNTDAITAFVEAQANMGKAIKNQKNAFLNNAYADLSAIQDAVIPAFASKGFVWDIFLLIIKVKNLLSFK